MGLPAQNPLVADETQEIPEDDIIGIGTFRPATAVEPKKEGFPQLSLISTPVKKVGPDIKPKPANDMIFEGTLENFENISGNSGFMSAYVDSLIKKNFTPEQVIRILEIFQENSKQGVEKLDEDQKELHPIADAGGESEEPGELSVVSAVDAVIDDTKRLEPVQSERVQDEVQNGAVLRPKNKISDIKPRTPITQPAIQQEEEVVIKEAVPLPPIEIDQVRSAIFEGRPIQEKPEPKVKTSEYRDDGETTQEAIKQVVHQELQPALGTNEKMRAISNIYDIFTRQRITAEQWAGPTASDVEASHSDEAFQPNLATKKIESWRDLLPSEEIVAVLKNVMLLSEELLISKYVPSYASTLNPSSWASVSEFDAYEVLNNPSDVYGLTHDPRLEVSKLITNMIDLAQCAQSPIALEPGLTVHAIYERVRSAVASADKRENT